MKTTFSRHLRAFVLFSSGMLASFVLIATCSSSESSGNTGDLPEALKHKSSTVFSSFGNTMRTSPRSILDELFRLVVEQDESLEELVDSLELLSEQHSGNDNRINTFVQKNTTYYEEARFLMDPKHSPTVNPAIGDLVLQILERSARQYGGHESELQKLQSITDSLDADAHAYFHAVKILTTLPVIERYQEQKNELAEANGTLNERIGNIRTILQKDVQARIGQQ